MDKKQQFITGVQTGVIVRSVLTQKDSPKDAMYHALTVIEDAIDAAERIPESMSANQAACEFLDHIYDDTPDVERNPFAWFMRS